jgi:hypothetical protein
MDAGKLQGTALHLKGYTPKNNVLTSGNMCQYFKIDTLTYLKGRHLKISPVKVTVKLTHFKRPPLDPESKVQESGWCTGSVLALGHD